jgi:hypothetical protein
MMLPVLWLRLKQAQGTLNYWLRLVDYDANDRDIMNRAYGVYLALFMVWWTAAMWAVAAGYVAGFGGMLPPTARQSVTAALPIVVLAGVVALLMYRLRSSPFKLSSPDFAYVAGSTVQRAVPVTIAFFGDLVLPVALGAIVISLVAVALNQRLDTNGALGVAVRSAVAIVPLLALMWGVAWLIGLARMVAPGVRRVPLLWLAPALLLALVRVAPETIVWPGNAFAAVLVGEASDLSGMGPVALAAVAAIILIAVLGSGLNMIEVADESLIYAKLKEIGILRWAAPTVYNRARSQYQAAKRKPILRLPDVDGLGMLVARSALAYVRNPVELLKLLIPVALVLGSLAFLAYQVPALLIIVVLWAVAFAPTSSLTLVFTADADDPFLRQFLAMDSRRLLLADSAFPGLLVFLVGAVLWLVLPMPLEIKFVGLPLAALLTLLLVFCRGASLLPLTPGRARVSYGVLAVIAIGLTLGAGLLLGGMLPALFAGALVAVILASVIASA